MIITFLLAALQVTASDPTISRYDGATGQVIPTQVSSSQQSENDEAYQVAKEEIWQIDAEIVAMQENLGVLRSKSAVRAEQIRSLRHRFPTIKLTDGANANDILGALAVVRRAKAAVLIPMAVARVSTAHAERCKVVARLVELRTSFERSDDFLAMSLTERIQWRKAFDEDMQRNPALRPCG